MPVEMPIVVAGQVLQGQFLVVDDPDIAEASGIQVGNEVQHKRVVGPQEVEHGPPSQTLGLLDGDPRFRLVGREDQALDALQVGEALVIVAGGIHEVAGNLPDTPVASGRPEVDHRLGHGVEQRHQARKGGLESRDFVFHGPNLAHQAPHANSTDDVGRNLPCFTEESAVELPLQQAIPPQGDRCRIWRPTRRRACC